MAKRKLERFKGTLDDSLVKKLSDARVFTVEDVLSKTIVRRIHSFIHFFLGLICVSCVFV